MLLAGTKVVEVGVWVAGPAVGGVLADWGADVVKVEPPTGDPMRNAFRAIAGIDIPSSPPFNVDNRGKKSVVLDLRSDDGRGLAQAALERFGVSGLRAGSVRDWKAQLRPQATAPVHGPLVPRCSAAVLPGTPGRLARGDASPVGWLLWESPSAPVAVQPAAVAVLRELDGERELAEIAASLEAPPEAVQAVAAELCRVGAAGPA